jgi:hypothetical protein
MAGHEDGYFALCKLWSSPEYIAISEKHRRNRGTDVKHTYSADGHLRMAKRMVNYSKLSNFTNNVVRTL